jgi:regulator of replication initiation timing
MAQENLESVSDPFALDDPLEQAPDSSPLRVSLNTQFESGIPPARLRDVSLASGIEHMDLALAGVTRTEASLGLLIRSLKHLAAGAIAAREANTELTHELDALRAHLTRSNEEEHALRFRMGQLEQLLDVIRHETTRERAFLIEQQDLFLVEIMSDHDRQIAELRRSFKEGAARSFDVRQRELEELIAQRDQAREYATRCERERDAAWLELSASEATPVPATLRPTPPPLPAARPVAADPTQVSQDELRGSSGKSSPKAIGSVSLRSVQAPATEAAPDLERTSERSISGTGYSLTRKDIAD